MAFLRSASLVPALTLPLAVFLAGCQPGAPAAPDMVQRADTAPATLNDAAARSGSCWATDVIPARLERVIEEVEVTPARRDARGRIIEPAVRVQGEHLREAGPAEERLFAVPCPDLLDADFIASLQRALQARGFYSGPAHGVMDEATGEAVRRYQAPQGLDSAILSLDAAQQLGLAAVPRERL